MSPSKQSSRFVALRVLTRGNIKKHDVSDLLHAQLSYSLRPGHTTDLVYGVIRNQTLLDHVIETCGSLKLKRIQPKLLSLLRIGTYEFIYRPETEPYAIIDEAVNLTRGITSRKGTGFVNAVLRSIQRAIENRSVDVVDADPARYIPQDPTRGCLFKQGLLPSVTDDPVDYLSVVFTLPKWLVAEWLERFGVDQTRQMCLASNRIPSMTLWPNLQRIDVAGLIEQLRLEEVQVIPSPDKTHLRIQYHHPVTTLKAFRDGLFYIQDPTAHNAAAALNPQPGWTVLDLCAAPGGKAMTLALMMKGTGTVIATDADTERLTRVAENVQRLQLNNIKVIEYNQCMESVKTMDRLDAVFVDVPCSNTGVLAKRPEVRHRLSQKTIPSLVGVQKKILSTAAKLLKPDGLLVYSTCSVTPQENSQLIQRFISGKNEFFIKEEQLTRPIISIERGRTIEFDHDGGYVAVLQKR